MQLSHANLDALRTHLGSELAAHLEHTGELPAEVRARLASELRAQIAACAAYIPPRLVRAQIDAPQPGRVSGAFWEGSLLFADLSGFTALSERLSVLGRQGAEEVSAVVSRLFDAVIAEIHAQQGALIKFGGDAVVAFFDSDALGASHAAAATAAALAMQRRMAAFAQFPMRAGSFTLRLRVGVHSGRVFAAEVGDASHIELVMTGPEVNRVAMAQEIADPGQVVLSEQTAALLSDAALRPAASGFLLAEAMPAPRLPAPTSDPIALRGPDDLGTLARLADRLAALRPYLVRGLPRRFLEAAETGLGEFRPVSVLFANVHDFSAILPQLQHDPQRAAAVFNAYFRRAQAVVHRYDGIVNKVDMYTHGDKLMALFGAPTAHEDDPTRAVRCALELRAALAEANREIAALLGEQSARTEEPRSQEAEKQFDASSAVSPDLCSSAPSVPLFNQKIGINTGTVFAGRVGGATRYEYTVMGPAVNLAARLMSAASDSEILLSPSARAAVAGHIELEDAKPLRLKGIAQPVTPARVLRVAALPGAARAETQATRLDAAPLIGRDAELAALLLAARAALAGQGRVLALVGEAGAGKSRLAEELLQRLVVASVASGAEGVPPFEILLGDCQSYEQRTAYAAVRAPLRELLGLGTLRPVADLAEHLAVRVRQLAPELERFTPLLGDAIGTLLDETPLTAALSAQQRHDRLQELVVALFCGVARRDPLLIEIEDIHWADSPSLELLGQLAAAAAELPLLLLLTYRPEPPIAAAWDALPLTLAVRLAELPPAHSAALLGALLGGSPPAAILPLLDRTQGNPFFIEELVRALVSGGVLLRDGEGGPWRLARRLEEVELPKSIEGLLIARLDRLDEPRQELVQVASVIGRRFPRPVVEAVYSPPETLDESLQRLISFELIQADQLERALAYLFRHALLRDVAYEGILFARRRVLHGRVARRIEELSRTQPDEQLALLAWHFLQAEEWRPALEYHVRAAQQAARRFANRDALALYAAALEIARHLGEREPETPLDAEIATIQEASGELRLLLGELDDAEAHFRNALDRAAAPESRLRLQRLLASVEERRSRYDAAFEWLRSGMARATAAMRGETARCYLLGAGIYFRQGDYLRAMEWARMGLTLAEQIDSPADQAAALKLIGNLLRDQGEAAQAIEALERARTLFAELNILSGQSDALNNLGQVYLNLGRWGDTIASYEESLRICESIGDVLGIARTTNNLAVVLVGRNQLQRAGELYKRSSEMFGRVGSALGVAVTTYNRGEVLLLQGRPTEAEPLFAAAIADFERIGARNFLPEVLRLAAEAALALGDLARADTLARRSLVLAAELTLAAEEAQARRVIGQVALAAGDFAAAEAELEQSRVALAQLDSRYDLGKTRYQQARLAATRGDSVAADAARIEAESIFAALDAQRDLDLVRAL